MSAPPALGDPLWVRTSSRTYPIYVGHGVIRELGAIMTQHELVGTLRVIADERVATLHGATIRAALAPHTQAWYRLPRVRSTRRSNRSSTSTTRYSRIDLSGATSSSPSGVESREIW